MDLDFVRLTIYFLFGIIIPAGFLSLAWSMLLTNLFGLAPYVPSSKESLKKILAGANLEKGQVFYDLGSGDGVVVEMATTNYGVKGIGVEINPFLVLFSKIKSQLKGLKETRYIRNDFLKINLKEAQVVFLYLLPRNLPKLQKKIEAECQRGTLVVSNSFPLQGWDNKLIKTVKLNHLLGYYYRL